MVCKSAKASACLCFVWRHGFVRVLGTHASTVSHWSHWALLDPLYNRQSHGVPHTVSLVFRDVRLKKIKKYEDAGTLQ